MKNNESASNTHNKINKRRNKSNGGEKNNEEFTGKQGKGKMKKKNSKNKK